MDSTDSDTETLPESKQRRGVQVLGSGEHRTESGWWVLAVEFGPRTPSLDQWLKADSEWWVPAAVGEWARDREAVCSEAGRQMTCE